MNLIRVKPMSCNTGSYLRKDIPFSDSYNISNFDASKLRPVYTCHVWRCEYKIELN